jgi:hypothetical protein
MERGVEWQLLKKAVAQICVVVLTGVHNVHDKAKLRVGLTQLER